jgi:hypothetical protein
MDLRRRLATASKSSAVEHEVRKELTLLRKALREQGYDLSLGKLELAFQGFRNDASTRQGFRRLVVFIGNKKLWVAQGEDNHVELHRRLEKALERSDEQVLQKHYLWYSWNHGQLILSGSDTETAEDFEALKAWCAQPERRLFLLSRLKTLT